MKVFLPICLMFFSYLLGSIPFGILIGKLKGVDIRNYGSHNIGATNALRVLGPALGILVFMLCGGNGSILLANISYRFFNFYYCLFNNKNCINIFNACFAYANCKLFYFRY